MLIVNADDFGRNNNVNRAIIESFDTGLCTNTTIMANGDSFDEACELARTKGICDHNMGIHINLTEGRPLSETIRKNELFCNEYGIFDGRAWNSPFILERSVKEIVATEISLQIKRCRKNIPELTHADSHHHIHTHPAIVNIILPLLKEEGIKRIRLSRNCGIGISFIKRAYKILFNRRLKSFGFQTVDFFGDVKDIKWLIQLKVPSFSKSIEIMIHPNYNEQNQLVDLDGSLLAENLKPLIDKFKLKNSRKLCE